MNSEWTQSLVLNQPFFVAWDLVSTKGEVFPSAATGVVRLQLERWGGVEIGRISQRDHMGPFFFWTSIQNHWNMAATWWLIPLSKWVITPVINGISRVNPLITGVISHLLSGMSHQVPICLPHGAGIWIPPFTPSFLWPSFVGKYTRAPWFAYGLCWCEISQTMAATLEVAFEPWPFRIEAGPVMIVMEDPNYKVGPPR